MLASGSLPALSNRPVTILLLLASALVLLPAAAPGADRSRQAADIKALLVEKTLPYWYVTTLDRTNGGFILADNGTGTPQRASEKQLVSQSRMIWGFAHAHLKGLGDGRRDYLDAAKQGYDFLQAHFKDRQNGGYFWTTDLKGEPISRNKIIYGQAFVIYGLVEYYRASGDKGALQQALELYRTLQERAHDPANGGWVEHFRADWTPILSPTPEAVVEVAGYKSANTHLHLMEAFAELYERTGDRQVRKSLEEALRINMKYFYPRKPGQSSFHRQRDWSPVTDLSSTGLSYGHNVEFAWLMLRAQEVLKVKPALTHFQAHIDHALKYGYDHTRGGLYNRGADDRPATDLDKVWWVQSEMLAALTDSLRLKPNPAHSTALSSQLEFIQKYQADPKDGVWFDTVTAEGAPKKPAKAHSWKANYHDLRALVKFIEAFSPPTSAVRK